MRLYEKALVGVLCGIIAPSAVASPQRSPLGAARDRMVIAPDAKGRVALGEVLKQFESLGDWKIVMDPKLRTLADQIVLWVSGPIEAEAEAVPLVMDALLARVSFTWTLVPDSLPLHLEVRDRDWRRLPSPAEISFDVPVDSIREYAEHAALIVRARVPLPNSDVEAICRTLPALVVDPNAMLIKPVPGSTDLEIVGSARKIARLVDILRTLDDPTPGAPQLGRPVPIPSSDESATLRPAKTGGPSTLDLVRSYAQATGQVAILTEMHQRLASADSLQLEQSMSASGAEFGSVAEAKLVERKFLVVELLADAPRLCSVVSLETSARGTASTDALFIDPTSAPECVRRPATLFLTVGRYPNLDVESVAGSMRKEIQDPFVQQVIPAGNSNTLLLIAYGPTLVEMMERLSSMDAEAAKGSSPAGR